MIGDLSIPRDPQPDPHPPQGIGIGGVGQQRHRPSTAGFQTKIQDDRKRVRVAARQSTPIFSTIAGFQSPALVQQVDAGYKTTAAASAVMITEPNQRQRDAGDERRLNPPRQAGDDDGDSGQSMNEEAAGQQESRGPRLKG